MKSILFVALGVIAYLAIIYFMGSVLGFNDRRHKKRRGDEPPTRPPRRGG